MFSFKGKFCKYPAKLAPLRTNRGQQKDCVSITIVRKKEMQFLEFNFHPWPQALGSDWKNQITGTSDRNEFPALSEAENTNHMVADRCQRVTILHII